MKENYIKHENVLLLELFLQVGMLYCKMCAHKYLDYIQ
jgi:hypothetical protein